MRRSGNPRAKTIAQRNLIWSIVAEHIAFSVWAIWSIVVTKLPQAGFHYTTDQLFQLVALPGLIGCAVAFSLHVCGNNVRRTKLDDLQRVGSVHSDHRARLLRNPAGYAVSR